MNLHELYELSVQLLASLDECIEMFGQVEGEQLCPQAGFVFEELAEVQLTPGAHKRRSVQLRTIG